MASVRCSWVLYLLRNVGIWTCIIAGILALLSLLADPNHFIYAFKGSLFYFGLFLIVAGGLVGAGFSEAVYYNSGLYRVSNLYMDTINKGRPERRDRQFSFTVYALLVGFILIFLAFALP